MIAGKVGTVGPAPPAGRLHEHLGQLLKRAWRDYRRSFRRCRRRFSGDSVHQLRVESRRLLAAACSIRCPWRLTPRGGRVVTSLP